MNAALAKMTPRPAPAKHARLTPLPAVVEAGTCPQTQPFCREALAMRGAAGGWFNRRVLLAISAFVDPERAFAGQTDASRRATPLALMPCHRGGSRTVGGTRQQHATRSLSLAHDGPELGMLQ